jgi:glucoselysine-6-phosphate deglycase
VESVTGLEVTVTTPTSLGRAYGKPLAVAVSQSGRSSNTMAAVEKLKGQGIPVATLTDPAETPVGRAGDLSLHLSAGNEQIGPKTRGFAATVFTLYLMALEIAGEADVTPLNEIIGNKKTYFESCENFLNAHMESIKKARHFMFAGKGASRKAAAEAALKVMETLCCPAAGYEFEEFLHGPAFCANGHTAFFLFLPCDGDKARVLQTAALLRRVTDNVYVVSHVPQVRGDGILYLPCPNPPLLSPVSDVLLAQLISSKLPDMLGRARHPAVLNIAKEMATKL